MFANAPAALRPLVELGQANLLHAELDARLRQIAILSVARDTGSEYERAQKLAGVVVEILVRRVGDPAHSAPPAEVVTDASASRLADSGSWLGATTTRCREQSSRSFAVERRCAFSSCATPSTTPSSSACSE